MQSNPHAAARTEQNERGSQYKAGLHQVNGIFVWHRGGSRDCYGFERTAKARLSIGQAQGEEVQPGIDWRERLLPP